MIAVMLRIRTRSNAILIPTITRGSVGNISSRLTMVEVEHLAISTSLEALMVGDQG
jgi:hypothetical protein